MKPRIFVSSTFYDLKYIRDDLSNFIKTRDFEPIMFEEGDIGYIPGKNLDYSCYEAMHNADMAILIIGGNYGSPASGEGNKDVEHYLSVTRKEYMTALNDGIPVFVFIDTTVYSEYGVYEANIELIEKEKGKINFCATKDINVFRFIKDIKSVGSLSITEFKKVGDIKTFLAKQWADMFKNYLKSLRDKKNSEQLHEALDNMSSLIMQMEVMVNGLGQKMINNDDNINYEDLINKQRNIKAIDIANKISKNIYCKFNFPRTNYENIHTLLEILCNFVKGYDEYPSVDQITNFLTELEESGIELKKYNGQYAWKDLLKDMCKDLKTRECVEMLLSKESYYSKILGINKEEKDEKED